MEMLQKSIRIRSKIESKFFHVNSSSISMSTLDIARINSSTVVFLSTLAKISGLLELWWLYWLLVLDNLLITSIECPTKNIKFEGWFTNFYRSNILSTFNCFLFGCPNLFRKDYGSSINKSNSFRWRNWTFSSPFTSSLRLLRGLSPLSELNELWNEP